MQSLSGRKIYVLPFHIPYPEFFLPKDPCSRKWACQSFGPEEEHGAKDGSDLMSLVFRPGIFVSSETLLSLSLERHNDLHLWQFKPGKNEWVERTGLSLSLYCSLEPSPLFPHFLSSATCLHFPFPFLRENFENQSTETEVWGLKLLQIRKPHKTERQINA